MPYTLKCSKMGRLIIVRHSGDVVCSEFESLVNEQHRLIDPENPPHLLVDVREASSYPDKADYFQWLAKWTGPVPVVDKVALVTGSAHCETIECIALAYMNKGLNARVFNDEMAALQWCFYDAVS